MKLSADNAIRSKLNLPKNDSLLDIDIYRHCYSRRYILCTFCQQVIFNLNMAKVTLDFITCFTKYERRIVRSTLHLINN